MNLPTRLRMMAKGCACSGDVVRADALALAAIDADRLTEENAKLREILEMVIFEAERNFDNSIDIDDLKEQLNQPKDQNNGK